MGAIALPRLEKGSQSKRTNKVLRGPGPAGIPSLTPHTLVDTLTMFLPGLYDSVDLKKMRSSTYITFSALTLIWSLPSLFLAMPPL